MNISFLNPADGPVRRNNPYAAIFTTAEDPSTAIQRPVAEPAMSVLHQDRNLRRHEIPAQLARRDNPYAAISTTPEDPSTAIQRRVAKPAMSVLHQDRNLRRHEIPALHARRDNPYTAISTTPEDPSTEGEPTVAKPAISETRNETWAIQKLLAHAKKTGREDLKSSNDGTEQQQTTLQPRKRIPFVPIPERDAARIAAIMKIARRFFLRGENIRLEGRSDARIAIYDIMKTSNSPSAPLVNAYAGHISLGTVDANSFSLVKGMVSELFEKIKSGEAQVDRETHRHMLFAAGDLLSTELLAQIDEWFAKNKPPADINTELKNRTAFVTALIKCFNNDEDLQVNEDLLAMIGQALEEHPQDDDKLKKQQDELRKLLAAKRNQ